jgi:hypothetical protein
MSSTFWFVVCLYLLVSAVSVLEAGFIVRKKGPAATALVCAMALRHGLSWPVRMALGARRP